MAFLRGLELIGLADFSSPAPSPEQKKKVEEEGGRTSVRKCDAALKEAQQAVELANHALKHSQLGNIYDRCISFEDAWKQDTGNQQIRDHAAVLDGQDGTEVIVKLGADARGTVLYAFGGNRLRQVSPGRWTIDGASPSRLPSIYLRTCTAFTLEFVSPCDRTVT